MGWLSVIRSRLTINPVASSRFNECPYVLQSIVKKVAAKKQPERDLGSVPYDSAEIDSEEKERSSGKAYPRTYAEPWRTVSHNCIVATLPNLRNGVASRLTA